MNGNESMLSIFFFSSKIHSGLIRFGLSFSFIFLSSRFENKKLNWWILIFKHLVVIISNIHHVFPTISITVSFHCYLVMFQNFNSFFLNDYSIPMLPPMLINITEPYYYTKWISLDFVVVVNKIKIENGRTNEQWSQWIIRKESKSKSENQKKNANLNWI